MSAWVSEKEKTQLFYQKSIASPPPIERFASNYRLPRVPLAENSLRVSIASNGPKVETKAIISFWRTKLITTSSRTCSLLLPAKFQLLNSFHCKLPYLSSAYGMECFTDYWVPVWYAYGRHLLQWPAMEFKMVKCIILRLYFLFEYFSLWIHEGSRWNARNIRLYY